MAGDCGWRLADGRGNRDPQKLRVFQQADALVLRIYESTRRFPAEERFGLIQQMRRAAVSICANIVEGPSRRTEPDYIRFLELARGSACEYLLNLSARLGFIADSESEGIQDEADHLCRALHALLESIEASRK